MNQPIISVIMPTYNNEKTINRAIKSVLSQSFKDFELIIINDASNDSTQKIIKSYNNPKIKLINRKINSCKISENARNDGLKKSKGKYISYIDADNSWESNHLELLYNYLEMHKDVDMVYCDSWLCWDNKKLLDRSTDFDKNLLMQRNYIDTGEVMHKKSIIKTLGGWPLSTGEEYDDWEFFKGIAKKYKIAHVKKNLSNYFPKTYLFNANYFTEKARMEIKENGKVTQKAISYVNQAIELAEKSKKIEEQKQNAKDLIIILKLILKFKNKKNFIKLFKETKKWNQ